MKITYTCENCNKYVEDRIETVEVIIHEASLHACEYCGYDEWKEYKHTCTHCGEENSTI